MRKITFASFEIRADLGRTCPNTQFGVFQLIKFHCVPTVVVNSWIRAVFGIQTSKCWKIGGRKHDVWYLKTWLRMLDGDYVGDCIGEGAIFQWKKRRLVSIPGRRRQEMGLLEKFVRTDFNSAGLSDLLNWSGFYRSVNQCKHFGDFICHIFERGLQHLSFPHLVEKSAEGQVCGFHFSNNYRVFWGLRCFREILVMEDWLVWFLWSDHWGGRLNVSKYIFMTWEMIVFEIEWNKSLEWLLSRKGVQKLRY